MFYFGGGGRCESWGSRVVDPDSVLPPPPKVVPSHPWTVHGPYHPQRVEE